MLEPRDVPSAAHAEPAVSFIYTETDNSTPGQNAVVAFSQSASGELTQIGTYDTGGTGVANTQGLLGPDDSDKEVIASANGHNVYAVNQGSNSVAAFEVLSNGSLRLIGGAAVGSNGTEPISLAISGKYLYVLNRGDELQGQAASIGPSITVFTINSNGSLKADVADTVTLTTGLSPSQLLIPHGSSLLFVDTFTPPPDDSVTGANEILPFAIGKNGQLTPAVSGGLGDPSASPPLLIGLAVNPTQDIIYGDLVGAGLVGVFTYNSSGDLSLVDTVATQGAGPCWATVSPNGKFLYTVDTGSNSVEAFSLANPMQPQEIQNFVLGGPQNSSGNSSDPRETTAFEFAFNSAGTYLFVIDHQTTSDGTFPQGNALHELAVAANGMLSEPSASPAFLPSNIPAGDDPQGVAVIPAHGAGSPTGPATFSALNDFEWGWAIALYESASSHQSQ